MDFLPSLLSGNVSPACVCVCVREEEGGEGGEKREENPVRITHSRPGCDAQPQNFSSGASRAAASPRRSRPSPRRRRDAAVRAGPAAGQRMLTPHGAPPARCLSEGERAAARLHRGHTFFNVSQGKFGLSCPVTSALARVAAPKAAFCFVIFFLENGIKATDPTSDLFSFFFFYISPPQHFCEEMRLKELSRHNSDTTSPGASLCYDIFFDHFLCFRRRF